MKFITTIVFLMVTNYGFCQIMNATVENQLEISTPFDLKEIWDHRPFNNSNRKFVYYNYGEMKFLSESDLHKFTLDRNVGGAMNESNSLYYKKEKEEITEKEYRTNKDLFFLDPVMTSKMVNGDLRQTYPKIKNSLVFAVSTWQEGFTYMFYAFDASSKNLGVWIWKLENSRYPVKIGDNIKDVFGDIEKLKNGFESIEKINKSLNDYHQEPSANKDNPTYGIYPQKDIRYLITETVPDVIFFTDGYTQNAPDSVLNAVSNLYSKKGVEADFESHSTTYLREYMDKLNKSYFDANNELNFFIIHISMSYEYGLVLITPEQGRNLNTYSLIPFGGREDTDNAFNFLSY